MEPLNLALICPVHVRHRFIKAAARQFMAIPEADVRVYYFLDRTTEEVNFAVFDLYEELGYVRTIGLPRPIVKGGRGDFPSAWSYMVSRVEVDWPEVSHMGIWDDDMILTDPEDVPNLLRTSDLVYGPKLFLWDDIEHYNERMEHNSVVFWRHRMGDRFHDKEVKQVHAPAAVHDDYASKRSTLGRFILDYGFMSHRDRKCVFEREIRTGKIDGFTMPLVEPPLRRRLPDDLLAKSREFSLLFAPE